MTSKLKLSKHKAFRVILPVTEKLENGWTIFSFKIQKLVEKSSLALIEEKNK